MAILDELLEELVLLPQDHEAMQQRGFSDKVIEKRRWRSCQPDNVRILDGLLAKHGIAALSQLQLFVSNPYKQGEWLPNPQLLKPNILIPYVDAENRVLKLRPHKMGFKGQPVLVYRPPTSFVKSAICIITESEFKADAAEQFGYAAIGIPGISSMSGQNWEYFRGELETIETGEFIIVFDNEIKDNPAYKNHKADWRKRYDTVIYAYAMCQKILNAGLHCKIATLPDKWMVEGKIDIDGALAQKRTPMQFAQVINTALAPIAYKKSAPIPEHHVRYFERRVRHFFYKAQVEIKNNCFHALPNKKDPQGRRLTNCTFHVKNVYEEVGTESTGVRRDLVISDEYGIDSRPVPILASSMASRGSFGAWLMSQGNYLFYGNETDINHIWEYVFNNDEGDIVMLMNRCGYIREKGFFLFKNALIKDDVTVLPDENGICWLDEVGYKVNKLGEEDETPSLVLEGSFDVTRFIDLLSDTTDHERPGMGKLLMAWVCAVMFLEAIQERHHLFPLLFLYGNRGSGKTTVMRWLTSFFGQQSVTKSLAVSSPVGISRLMSYYANLPLVVDDWRADAKSRSFNTYFLGVYNRQSGAKGVKAKFGLQQTDVRSALAILGEEMIDDNGLQTRCLSFYMPMDRKRECMDEVDEIIDQASVFTYNVLTTQYATMKEKVLNAIDASIVDLGKKVPKVEKRIIINNAIALGAYHALIGPDEDLEEFVLHRVTLGSQEMAQGDKMHRFAEEFSFGVAENMLQPHHFRFSDNGRTILLWVKGICDIMNRYYNRNHTDHSRLLIQHFSQQPYFERAAKTCFKGSRGAMPAIELCLGKMPESIRGYFESARGIDEVPS